LIRHIHDPEHPHSLEQLGVVFKAGVQVSRECGPPVSPAARPGTGVDGRSGAVGVGSPGSSMGIAVAVRASSNGAHDDDTADGVGASFVGGVPTEHEVVEVEFKPTVPHCSLATLIGLCIRTKILLTIPHAKLTIRIKEGAHQTADQSQQSTRASPNHCCLHGSLRRGGSTALLVCSCVFVCGSVEKQLNDKERATAALENPALRDTVVRLIKEAHAYN
jgi:hypothetical protein